MTMMNSFLITITLMSTLSSAALAQVQRCILHYTEHERILLQQTKDYFSSLINVDLLKYRNLEVRQVAGGIKYGGIQNLVPNAAIDALIAKYGNRGWTTREITEELNEQTFKTLEAYRPNDKTDKRFDFLPSKDLADLVLRSIDRHPVVSERSADQYQQKGAEIGYCFGRGCYVDLMLMRLGLDRDSIKKIWAVGPMGTGKIIWQFHIGHLVRLPDNSWVAIDNVPSSYRVLDARSWGEHFKNKNKDGELRLYITDSDKFTPTLGAYDPVNMGLNANRTSDWYKGYFQDLMDWFRDSSDHEIAEFLGISALPSRPIPMNPTPEQIAQSEVEEYLYSQLPPRSVPNKNTGPTLNNNNDKGNRFSGILKYIRRFKQHFHF